MTEKTVILAEALDLSESVVDTENRVIKGVVLIRAGMSMNKRFYTEKSLEEAVSVFDNSKAYADHPSKEDRVNRPERSIRDLSGWYSNVRYTEGKLIADRYFTRNQAGNDTWAIAEDIANKRAPSSLAGLSINAVGKGTMKKYGTEDALEVTNITAANSVDDVSQPSAKGSYLLTASYTDGLAEAYIKELTYEQWFESRPEFVKRVQGELKTVRQDDAVKAAKVEADSLKATLAELQESLDTMKAERDAALVEAQSTARKLVIVETLGKVTLPKSFKDDLQERLLTLDESEWSAVIEKEISKAKAANVLPRVTTTGANPSIHMQLTEAAPVKPKTNWANVDTPEKQKAVLESRKQ